jgi:hypothetical protein
MLIQNEYAIPNYMTTRVFNVKLSQVVKNQQLLSDKHLFYCLKSINVRTILKFITFEFILIAHHYETFIYSLIELHCFTFS